MDEKDAIESVGTILSAFLKAGSQSEGAKNAQDEILAIVDAAVISPEASTRDYEKRCDEFLGTVIKAKGLPVREISYIQPAQRPHSGSDKRKQSPDLPVSKLQMRRKECVDNYRRQSRLYFDGEVHAFRCLLSRFLERVPAGGSTAKEARSEITAIKRAFRDLTKWDRLFSTIKATSFPAAIGRTIELEGNPLAAVWCYNMLDEQGEFRNAYSHKELDGRVYAVRGNWALEKGLMTAGPDGYVDDIAQPGEEFDCMCHYRWLYSLGALPEAMLTAKGREELKRARAQMRTWSGSR